MEVSNYFNNETIQQTAVTAQIITDYINENNFANLKRKELFDRYKGVVSILNRKMPDINKINNKLVNNYRQLIVDQAVGYFLGTPIFYSLKDDNYSETEKDRYKSIVDNFLRINNSNELDFTTALWEIITGVSYRLLYIDKQGQERMINQPSYEVIAIKDASLDIVTNAIIYYNIEIIADNKRTLRKRAEYYDNKFVWYYIEGDNGFVLDNNVEVNPQPHLFDYCPVIEFKNNEILHGDFQTVETLIDAYDTLISDIQNELEETRLAYMIFNGEMEITNETVLAARQSGAFVLPAGCDVKYLTKDINKDFIDLQLKELKENIYSFSSTVNMADDKFSGGTQSGESRKWKLLSLENKTATKERLFAKSLRQLFQVVCSAWNKKNININYSDIDFLFTRNLPTETTTIVDNVVKLTGIVSKETQLKLLPFIKNVDHELEEIAKEREDSMNLDALLMSTTNDNANTDTNNDNTDTNNSNNSNQDKQGN